MALTTGSRLGRYVILRQLGAGAMGEVYLAEDPHIDRRVAIKTVRVDVQENVDEATRNQLRLRFEREAKAAGRLVHPHVVTLFDAADVEGLFFLAFEFIDGPDVAHRARQEPPLTLREIVRIGREAASALDAAHRVGIIHRDIKPANLLLTPDGVLKIADFGIATLVDQGAHLTQTGLLVGTPQYLSPEQVTGEKLDGRTDLFSLGVVLYELLSGRRPFDGGTIASLLYAVVSSHPPTLSELRPDLPPRLAAAVMRLLAKAADDRFATAGAAARELEAIEGELGLAGRGTNAEALPPDQLPTLVVDAPHTVGTDAAVTELRPTPPTLVVDAPRTAGTDAALTELRPTPSTLQASDKSIEVGKPGVNVPPTRLESKAPPRRSGRLAIVALTAAALGAGLFAAFVWFGAETSPPVATQVEQPRAEPRRETELAPPIQPVESTTDVQPAPTATMTAVEEYRAVGGMVTFQVTPPEAAERVVVKIDGLVRGAGELATGSGMTMRPGKHEIEITSNGFKPAKLLVESTGDGVTDLSVALEKN